MKAGILLLLPLAVSFGQTCPVVKSRVTVPPRSRADTRVALILDAFASPILSNGFTIGGDLSGSSSFEYCPTNGPFLTRPTPSNTMLLIQYGPPSTLLEVDANGSIVNSITQDALNAQLSSLGVQPAIDFNHEAIRLSNGYTALITHVERLYTNVQGSTGTVDILGNQVVILDPNWNVSWTWNAYDHLDINRSAILGETCGPNSPINGGCPVKLASQANDWLHGNSLYYDPADGNVVISLRSQDWVIKFAYQDGSGDGQVIWRLGNQGDFAMLNTHGIANPWFSHQHDAEFETSGSPRILSLLDNGNTRYATDPAIHSRGMALSIDEDAMTADVFLATDMGSYSQCYGSAQMLPNGNFWFSSGYIAGANRGSRMTYAKEIVPDNSGFGHTVFAISNGYSTYRTFRTASLP